MEQTQIWHKFILTFKENLEKQSKSSITIRGYLADLRLFEKWYKGVKSIFFCTFPPGQGEYISEFSFWVDSAWDYC